MIHETVGDFWFAALSVLAIVGPLMVFSIIFGIAKWRGYSNFWMVITVTLTLVAIIFALAFMFTQWTLSTETYAASTSIGTSNPFSPVGMAGLGVAVAWVGGGALIAWMIDSSK